MIGAWRKHWTLRGRTASLTGVLVLAGLAGCGGEQRSGVVSRDTTPSSVRTRQSVHRAAPALRCETPRA